MKLLLPVLLVVSLSAPAIAKPAASSLRGTKPATSTTVKKPVVKKPICKTAPGNARAGIQRTAEGVEGAVVEATQRCVFQNGNPLNGTIRYNGGTGAYEIFLDYTWKRLKN